VQYLDIALTAMKYDMHHQPQCNITHAAGNKLVMTVALGIYAYI